jgi:hypothetical protein
MRAFVLLALLAAPAACGQLNTMNSTASDAILYAGGGSNEFRAVRQVVIQKCATCHYHDEFAYYSEQDYIDYGFVVAQDLAASEIYRRLDSNTVGGEGGMPVDDSLTAAELQAFEDWIASLTP